MSKKENFQLKILRDFLNGRKLCQINTQEDGTICLTNGFMGYVFRKSELLIDYKKLPVIDFNLNMDKDRRLTDTHIRCVKNGKTVVKLSDDSGTMHVYIDNKYFREFSGCEFWGSHPLEPVLAKDAFGRVVGVICTIRTEGF